MLLAAFIIAGIAVGAFLLSLMLSKKLKTVADKFLILYLSFFILSQGYFYFEADGMFQHTPWMLAGRGIYLLAGPLFFYYVYCLTTRSPITRKLYLITLLPFFAYFVHFLYYYLVGFKGEQITIADGLLYINGSLSVTWTFFVVLLIMSDPLYLLWFYLLLTRYRETSVEQASSFDQINLRWLEVLFYLWALSSLIFLPVIVLSIGREWFSGGCVQVLLQLDYLIFVFLLGFYGFRTSSVFSISIENQPESRQTKKSAAPYERSGLTTEQASTYHRQLIELMKYERPYLKGELTALELATQLGVTTNHLSQVINQIEGKNFFDFINSYRIEEVKNKMADSRSNNVTLLAMALESGFNSKTSFNIVFKKMTGQTPSQYYKAVRSRQN